MEYSKKFTTVLPSVGMSTAYGIDYYRKENVEMESQIDISPKYKYGGCFESYDVETGGDDFYAEGNLEIEKANGKLTLTGYDGVFELPDYIVEAVREAGIQIEL